MKNLKRWLRSGKMERINQRFVSLLELDTKLQRQLMEEIADNSKVIDGEILAIY